VSNTWQRLRHEWADRDGAGTVPVAARNGQAPLLRPRAPEAPSGRPQRARRLLRPLPLAGAALVLVALIGYWSIYSATTKRTPILVAAHNLAAGSLLRPSDLRTAELAGDAATMAALLPERELASVLGRQLATPVSQGAPISLATIESAGSGPAAFTLVVPALHALAGSLQPGDRVTVLATFDTGNGNSQARVIARGLRVETVGRPPEGLDRASASIPITLALPDPSLATALALANSDAKIDLLRDGRRGETAPIPSTSVQAGP